jgi:pimeloyl-ACP methyl ester carboxylesterase
VQSRPGYRVLVVGVLAALVGASCTYLRYASIQSEYKRLQDADPSQRNVKHMIDRPKFSVIGRTEDSGALYAQSAAPIAVAAFSSRFRPDELVDVMHDIGVGKHFGLDLPAGDYELVVLMDVNGDRIYDRGEVIGRHSFTLPQPGTSSTVLTRLVVELTQPSTASWNIELPVVSKAPGPRSLFFPAGTIRELTDPIFSDEMVTLGLYDPASFFEQSPTLFYALEEDLGFKTPVIFVHGASGSARGFDKLVAGLDRTRFKPWFFHYPSGGNLDQLAELFYEIFLSGHAVAPNEFVPTVIVAHSMGGLIVRKALSMLRGHAEEPWSIEWISLATPFGGHPAARGVGDSRMMILPSWRDLDPDSAFLAGLYADPLPATVTHHLLYAYGDDSMVKLGENSDGVVPLSSQLYPAAQRQSDSQLGINTTHVGIQRDAAGIAAVLEILGKISTRIPPQHLAVLLQGGFEVDPGAPYGEMERFLLRNYGHFLEALACGELEPSTPSQRQLVAMLRGEAEPTFPGARAWLAFVANGRR